jgi:hypothetical protein
MVEVIVFDSAIGTSRRKRYDGGNGMKHFRREIWTLEAIMSTCTLGRTVFFGIAGYTE